jgi:hypothetical protein
MMRGIYLTGLHQSYRLVRMVWLTGTLRLRTWRTCRNIAIALIGQDHSPGS